MPRAFSLLRVSAALCVLFSSGAADAIRAVSPRPFIAPQGVPIEAYRWYNPRTGDHFYTADPSGELAPRSGYQSEGVGFRLWNGPGGDRAILYRWYNPGNGDHFYTVDPSGELAPRSGYQPEQPLGYVHRSPVPGTVALNRWYNPRTGDHFYTVDPTGELAPRSGYQSEGITGYVLPPQGAAPPPPPPMQPPQADALGSLWQVSESGWSGTWSRLGGSNQFNAHWALGAGRVTGQLSITAQGNTIQVVRPPSSDGVACNYLGQLSSDGSTVTGTYTCNNAQQPLTWWARIVQR